MATSNSEVKVQKDAQAAVDTAESKINSFKNFLGKAAKGLGGGNIPDEAKVTKAKVFVKDMPQGKEEKGGLASYLADASVGLILGLPLLFRRGNEVKKNEPLDLESEYEGDEKALIADIKEEEKIREKGIEALEETKETGKKLDKKKIEDIKNIKKPNQPGSGVKNRTTTTTMTKSGYGAGEGDEGLIRQTLPDGSTKYLSEKEAKELQTKVTEGTGSGPVKTDVTVTTHNAEKFEEAIDNLKIRLKKNVLDKKPDTVSAAKSVKSDDDVKPVLNELEGERKELAKERLNLEKRRKQIQSIYGRDSVEYEEITVKISKNKEKVKELPKASKGGIIQGPQEGYPVSLDGKKVDFIGHGTEEVRQKKDGNGAFIIPIDTPDTRKDPKLMERRQKEAAAMGFKSFSAGGMNPDKVFGAPLLDKDSDLYKYSGIDKVHENAAKTGLDLQGTKYESSEELARTTTKASEFDTPLKVERKSSLMTPQEQYEFLANQLGPDNVMQLVDGTYFPNVGKMVAEKWGDVARMVEKYMTEGASTVKEVSGVSIDKEVKQALRTFKKTFKDYEQFKDPKTGEYDIPAMTEHLNSYVPGTINYAKVQMEAAKKEEKKQERKDKMMEQVRNKSMGGFLKIDGLNSYSQGGVLQDVMTYPEYSDGGEAQQSSSPIPIPIPLPSPSASAPPLPQGTPPPDVPMIMGSTDGEVMQAFLFNELGAS